MTASRRKARERDTKPSSRKTRAFLVGAAGFVCLLFVGLQLPPLKSVLRVGIERLVNESGNVSIKTEGLSGILPFTVGLSSLQLGDGQGVWLESGAVSARLDVLALLEGTIRLKRISAKRVLLKRAPKYASSRTSARGFPVGLQVDTFVFSDVVIVPARLRIDEAAGELRWNFHQSLMDARVSLSGRSVMDSSDSTGPRVGPFTVEARLHGAPSSPVGEIQLTTSRVETGRISAAAMTWSLHLVQPSGAHGDGQAFRLAAAAEGLQGAASGSAQLRADGRLNLGQARVRSRVGLRWDPGKNKDPLAVAMGSDSHLEATVDLHDGTLVVTELQLKGRTLEVTGNADYGLRDGRLHGDLSAKCSDLGPFSFLTGKPLSGSLEAAVAVRGSLRSLGGEFAVTAGAVAIDGSPAVKVGAKLEFSGLPTQGRGSGGITVTAGEGAVATLRFRLADVSRAGFALEDLKLSVPGSSVDGALAFRASDRRWTGSLRAHSSDLSGLEDFVGVELAGGLDADLLLGASGGGQEIRVKGKAHDIRLASGEIRNFEVQGDGKLARLRIRMRADGDYLRTFSVELEGNVSVTQSRAEIELRKLTALFGGERVVLRRPLSLSREGDALRMETLDLRVAGGEVSGTFAKTANSLSGGFQLRAIPVELLGLYDSRLQWSGSLDGRLSLSGSPSAPVWDFEAASSDLRLGVTAERQSPVLRVRAQGGREAEAAHLELTVEQGTGERLEITSATDAASRLLRGDLDAPLTVTVKGSADLAALPMILGEDGTRAAGDLEADVQIHGSLRRPLLGGTLELQQGGYENSSAGIAVREVSARVHGDGSRLVLDSLQAKGGHGGDLKASGNGEFSDGLRDSRYRVDVAMKKFRALERDDLDAVFSGTLTLEGRGAEAKVAGSLDIERADVTVPERLPPEIAVLEVEEKNRKTSGYRNEGRSRPWARAVALNLELRAPGRVFVRGQDLDSEWKGKLVLGGTLAQPLPSGDLHVVRGTVGLLGLTFRVRSGAVGFDGRAKIDPVLDVVAETRRNSVTARVTIRGRSSDPEFLLDSEPAMPRDEIVSQLLFGKSSGGLSAVQGIQLAQALAGLTGKRRGFGLMQRVRATLGTDVLEVSGAGSLRIGKYLRKGVYVSVDQGLAEQGSTATVQVELTPNIRVETEVGSDQRNSVELNWRWNY